MIDLADVEAKLYALIDFIVERGENLMQTWILLQFALLAALAVAAHLIARKAAPRLDVWLRGLPNKNVSGLRFPLLILRRLRPITFVLLAWASVLAIRSLTWPSRSYYVAAVASLVAALVIISITSRIIRNRFLRVIVSWTACGFFLLSAFGLLQDAETILDSAAIQLGEVRVSALLLIKAAVTLASLLVIANWVSRIAARRIAAIDDISPSMQVLSEKLLKALFYGAALLFGLQAVGFDLTSITVLSGAIGLGLGFGLQKVVSNLVSGVILLIDRSIKPGDVISLGETFGWIQHLGARYVSVLTRDGREFLVPNEDLITGQVINWSYSNEDVRLDIYFGVSYASDPHVVRRVAREAAATVNRVVTTSPPVCHIVGFGDSSIDLILRFWIKDPTNGLTNVRGDVYLAIWDAFKANGIQIPYPRRDVTILKGGAYSEDAART